MDYAYLIRSAHRKAMPFISALCLSVVMVPNNNYASDNAPITQRANPSNLHQNLEAKNAFELHLKLEQMLTSRQDPQEVNTFLNHHLDLILKDHNTIITAISLARQNGHHDLALNIADRALAEGFRTARLLYEIGLVLLFRGDCNRASIIFQRIIHPNTPAPKNNQSQKWIKIKSRQALMLCQELNGWKYKYDVTLTYDNNIAGTPPAQKIRPEENSPLGVYLSSIAPDLAITLGEKPRQGTTALWRHYLDRYYYRQNQRFGIHLQSDIIATLPTGYEQLGVRLGMSRTLAIDDFIFRNRLDAYHHRYGRGKHNTHAQQKGINLKNTISWQRTISPSLEINLGQHQSKTNTTLNHISTDLSLRLHHRPTHTHALRWFVAAGTKRNIYQNPIHDSRTTYTLAGINKIKINDTANLSLQIANEITHPKFPQLWREHKHKTKTNKVTATYHIKTKTHSLDISASLSNVHSNNQFENFDRFLLSLRIETKN